MEHIDTAVVGAGVVGLAAALAIARRGRSVCVLEREPRPGLGTSTHNSQVIHAGMYYPAGTAWPAPASFMSSARRTRFPTPGAAS
jgi:L-2-hydroxyglutarate oxidase LhgO